MNRNFRNVWILHKDSPVKIKLTANVTYRIGNEIYEYSPFLSCITLTKMHPCNCCFTRYASWLGETIPWLNMPTTPYWRAEQAARPVRLPVWRETSSIKHPLIASAGRTRTSS